MELVLLHLCQPIDNTRIKRTAKSETKQGVGFKALSFSFSFLFFLSFSQRHMRRRSWSCWVKKHKKLCDVVRHCCNTTSIVRHQYNTTSATRHRYNTTNATRHRYNTTNATHHCCKAASIVALHCCSATSCNSASIAAHHHCNATSCNGVSVTIRHCCSAPSVATRHCCSSVVMSIGLSLDIRPTFVQLSSNVCPTFVEFLSNYRHVSYHLHPIILSSYILPLCRLAFASDSRLTFVWPLFDVYLTFVQRPSIADHSRWRTIFFKPYIVLKLCS